MPTQTKSNDKSSSSPFSDIPPSLVVAQETEKFLEEFRVLAYELGVSKQPILRANQELDEAVAAWLTDYQAEQAKCCWPRCAEAEVMRSHTLQRNGALKAVTEGELFELAWMPVAGLVPHRTGRLPASIFPGFCKTHEQKFLVFETSAKLSQENHYNLQLFRTAVKEHWRRVIASEFFSAFPTLIMNWRRNFSWIDCNFNAGFDFFIERCELRAVTQRITAGHLSGISAELAEMCTGIKTHSFNESSLPPRLILATEILGQVPYAFSGALHLFEGRYSFVLLLVVIPQGGKTLVLMTSEQPNAGFLERFRQSFVEDCETLISTVEAFARFCPDDWYFEKAWIQGPEGKKMREFASRAIPMDQVIPLDQLMKDTKRG